jgi:hypothetical protein
MKLALALCALLTVCTADTMRSYMGQDIRNVELTYGPPVGRTGEPTWPARRVCHNRLPQRRARRGNHGSHTASKLDHDAQLRSTGEAQQGQSGWQIGPLGCHTAPCSLSGRCGAPPNVVLPAICRSPHSALWSCLRSKSVMAPRRCATISNVVPRWLASRLSTMICERRA